MPWSATSRPDPTPERAVGIALSATGLQEGHAVVLGQVNHCLSFLGEGRSHVEHAEAGAAHHDVRPGNLPDVTAKVLHAASCADLELWRSGVCALRLGEVFLQSLDRARTAVQVSSDVRH